jgi:spermidine synthase
MINKSLVVSFLASFCSFSFFSLFLKKIAQVTGHEIYTQTILTGVFLVMVSLGVFLSRKIENFKLKHLILVELFMSCFFCILPIAFSFFEVYYFSVTNSNQSWYVFAAFIVTPLGICSGLELPIILQSTKLSEGKVLFFNYLGSFFSSILIAFFLLSSWNFFNICIFFSLLNFFLTLFIMSESGDTKFAFNSFVFASYSIFNVAVCLFAVHSAPIFKNMSYLKFSNVNFLNYNFWKNGYYLAKNEPRVKSVQTPYQQIDILRQSDYFPKRQDFKRPDGWKFYLNHRLQVTEGGEEIYHQTMAFFPLVYGGKLENILILGGGDFGLARELYRVGNPKITLVELDKKMVDLVKKDRYLSKMHIDKSVFEKVNMITDDAFNFVRNTSEKFDIIYLDFPYPNSMELNKLYSKEFYSFVEKRLMPGGIVILDFPSFKGEFFNNLVATVSSSLRSAGLSHIKTVGQNASFIMVSKEKLKTPDSAPVIEKFAANKSIGNFIDTTKDNEEFINKPTNEVYSIFRPKMNFRVSQ